MTSFQYQLTYLHVLLTYLRTKINILILIVIINLDYKLGVQADYITEMQREITQ